MWNKQVNTHQLVIHYETQFYIFIILLFFNYIRMTQWDSDQALRICTLTNGGDSNPGRCLEKIFRLIKFIEPIDCK